VVKLGGQKSRRKQADNFRVYCIERGWLRMECLLCRRMGIVINKVVKLKDFVKGINISLLTEEGLSFRQSVTMHKFLYSQNQSHIFPMYKL